MGVKKKVGTLLYGLVVLGCNGPSWQVHRQRQNIISSCVADTQDTLSSALRKSIRTKSTFNYTDANFLSVLLL